MTKRLDIRGHFADKRRKWVHHIPAKPQLTLDSVITPMCMTKSFSRPLREFVVEALTFIQSVKESAFRGFNAALAIGACEWLEASGYIEAVYADKYSPRFVDIIYRITPAGSAFLIRQKRA